MINVAIISDNQHIQKSLSLLVKTDPELNIIKTQEIVLDKKVVLLVDTEIDDLEDCLRRFSKHIPIILYSHSKDFLDMSYLLNKYKVNFFNVYTKPECILNIIKEPFC